MPEPSATLAKLPPYLFAELDRKVAEARSRGVNIINLGIGDPDLPTPKSVVEALVEAARDPATHNYPPYVGTPDYRAAATAWLQKRFSIALNADKEILALLGSKEGLAHLIFAYVQPGDVVLCPSPAYPVYNNYTLLCGGEPVTVPLRAANGFLPDFADIPSDAAKRAKLLFLNYPNNPTGAVANDKFIAEAIAFCRGHDILLAHDNAYSEMTFDGYRAPAFLQQRNAQDICIEFFSLSKMMNMTGWRIGFAAGNTDAIQALGKVKANTDSGPFKAIQRAAQVGLANADALTAEVNETYQRRRDLMVEGLRQLGWTDFAPGPATFFLWAPVPRGVGSAEFCDRLLQECGIVASPGTGFGPEGEGFFRIALTVPEARLKEALARLEKADIFKKAKAA